MQKFTLQPGERHPDETGLCCLADVYRLEELGMRRADALLLSPEQAGAAIAYFTGYRAWERAMIEQAGTVTPREAAA